MSGEAVPQGLDFRDPRVTAANLQYIKSLHPEVRALYAGSYGEPGAALAADVRMALAAKLASQGKKVQMLTDAMGWLTWYAYMSALVAGGYSVFSYIGEPSPDWTTTRPNDPEPGLPPYNPAGHTGIVSFVPPAPFVAPTNSVTKSMIGLWSGAYTDQMGIPGPSRKVYVAASSLGFAEGFSFSDPVQGPTCGQTFDFHIGGDPAMDAPHRAKFWLAQSDQ